MLVLQRLDGDQHVAEQFDSIHRRNERREQHEHGERLQSLPSCQCTDDNIFRQVRVAGGTARSYVEGATTGCSTSGNAAKHIPALYYFGTYTDATGTHNDHDFCNTEVRPYSEFDVNNLPTYAFVTPTFCNDGHDCGDSTVDAWARANIQPVLDSAAYKAETVAVFIWYDEDRPTPNAQIAPTSHKGDISQTGVGTHAALLKTIEGMLGVPLMNQGQLPAATDLRSLLGIWRRRGIRGWALPRGLSAGARRPRGIRLGVRGPDRFSIGTT